MNPATFLSNSSALVSLVALEALAALAALVVLVVLVALVAVVLNALRILRTLGTTRFMRQDTTAGPQQCDMSQGPVLVLGAGETLYDFSHILSLNYHVSQF